MSDIRKTAGLIRGELAAALLREAQVCGDLVALQDSLSWGPVMPGDSHDSLRTSFWEAATGSPPVEDHARLEAHIAQGQSLPLVLWPQSGLDNVLATAWAIYCCGVMTRAAAIKLCVPCAFDTGVPSLRNSAEANDMARHTRQVTDHERAFATHMWSAHLKGQLHLAIGPSYEASGIPVWLRLKEPVRDRFPLQANGLPVFIQQLLQPLNVEDSMPVSRLVGGFISLRWGTPLAIDVDVVLFQLIKDLANLNLVAITAEEISRYPARSFVGLTEFGREVVAGQAEADVRNISALRWWGGRELATITP